MALTATAATTAPARPNRAIARFAGLVFAASIGTAAVLVLINDDSQPSNSDPRRSAPAVVDAPPVVPAAAEHVYIPPADARPVVPAAAEHVYIPEPAAEHTLNP